jgi:hypothetical protein
LVYGNFRVVIAGLLQSPITLPFDVDSSTTLRIKSTSLLNVGLIRGLRIDDNPYIYHHVPRSLRTPPKTLIHVLLVRIRANSQDVEVE